MKRVGRDGCRFSHILVMGVSGSGKTTVSRELTRVLGGAFVEADDYHPEGNIALMSAGQPLMDSHRWPWLEAVSFAATRAMATSQGPVVIACSALKRTYRDCLRSVLGPMLIVHLDGPVDLIDGRLKTRHGHFMSASLLPSQFATLEALERDEVGIVVSADEPIERIVEEIVAWLSDGCVASAP